jgi:nicotinamide-nucleotide amidase
MPSFLDAEQEALTEEIATLLTDRGETIAVAESTTGGLVSAALLSIAGASRYYRGGGVLYTLDSRVALAGMDRALYANYQGTTPEMLAQLAEATRVKLDATWAIAESGLAGPTSGRSGAPPGRTTIAVAGPLERSTRIETGLSDRGDNMAAFTSHTLRFLRDTLLEARA